jgi:hypothetical protein
MPLVRQPSHNVARGLITQALKQSGNNKAAAARLGEDGWQGRNRRAAEYWIVHDPRPPAGSGETWTIVDKADYFSLYARGRERFYAIRRLLVPSQRSSN